MLDTVRRQVKFQDDLRQADDLLEHLRYQNALDNLRHMMTEPNMGLPQNLWVNRK